MGPNCTSLWEPARPFHRDPAGSPDHFDISNINNERDKDCGKNDDNDDNHDNVDADADEDADENADVKGRDGCPGRSIVQDSGKGGAC